MVARMTRVVFALAVLALALPAAARADDAAPLYDPANVAQIDITLSDEARAALAADPSEYVDGTFALTAEGIDYGPETVEVRLKGKTSFRPLGQKAAFKVKFPKANRLLGLKSVTLNNMVQDPSMLHETLAYEVFRAAGVAAPRTGYAYVRVNGAGYGLYLNLESYDDISMERLFGSAEFDEGHLYEADLRGIDAVPGDAGRFEVDEGDEDDIGDLEALIAAANATGGDWSDGMAATADLGAMTRMWAGEGYIGHWDGYSVSPDPDAMNNYYLFSDEAGRFTMLPTGVDQTFFIALPFANGDAVLMKRCAADASCLAAYDAGLGGVADAADAMGVGARLDALATTVATWRRCADLEQASDADWQTAVTSARAFIRERRKAVAARLGRPAPSTPPALASTARPPLSTSCGSPPEPPSDPDDPDPASPAGPAAPPAASAVLGAQARRLLPLGLTARVGPRRGRRVTITGRLRLPAGTGRAGLCQGRVIVRVMTGRRLLARRAAALGPDCRYAVSATVRSRHTLTVKARFMGTDGLLPRSAASRTLRRPRA